MEVARRTAIGALIFVAISGLVGGVPLILHAHGEPWWMTQSLLRYSPFHSFFFPGLILFSSIGLLSCWVLWLTVTNRPGYGWWISLQGCVLVGWIVVEVLMLRLVMWAQLLYAGMGLLLVVLGILFVRRSTARILC